MSVLELDVTLPLDRFELRVELRAEAPVTGIFGASGAGKTSLLEVVAGLRRGASGRVALGGETWLDSGRGLFLRPERRRLGYVPQDGLLFPHWNVRRNLLAGSRRAGEDAAKSLGEVVELLELGPLLGRSVTTLSGGERQRVALGRALCSGPSLLLLDEPMASLDLPLRRRLLPFLERVRSELTVPMLLVSHDPLDVQALCDDLVVLASGRVLARGEPRQVLTDPSVFSLATEQGFENVLTGRLLRHDDGTSVVELAGGVSLVAGRVEMEPGREVIVSLPATDIVLAVEEPRGVSARNVLEARVLDVRAAARQALVDVQLGGAAGPKLAVEVAASTPAELGLEVGGAVHLLIKATSCRLYGA